jgi:hypothetical protein
MDNRKGRPDRHFEDSGERLFSNGRCHRYQSLGEGVRKRDFRARLSDGARRSART